MRMARRTCTDTFSKINSVSLTAEAALSVYEVLVSLIVVSNFGLRLAAFTQFKLFAQPPLKSRHNMYLSLHRFVDTSTYLLASHKIRYWKLRPC